MAPIIGPVAHRTPDAAQPELVSWKQRKKIADDLKEIYSASTVEQVDANLICYSGLELLVILRLFVIKNLGFVIGFLILGFGIIVSWQIIVRGDV